MKSPKVCPLISPSHLRTKQKIEWQQNADMLNGITVFELLPYLGMQCLQMSASVILTGSGSMQKEAYLHKVLCITLRDETEWFETLEAGWNQLAGANAKQI